MGNQLRDNFINNTSKLTGSCNAASQQHCVASKFIPAQLIETIETTEIEHNQQEEAKFRYDEFAHENYTLQGCLSKGKVEKGFGYGAEDVHLDDHGFAKGHNSACGDVMSRVASYSQPSEILNEGVDEINVLAEVCNDDVDLTDVFDQCCENPEEAITERVYEQIEEEIGKLVNQAVCYAI